VRAYPFFVVGAYDLDLLGNGEPADAPTAGTIDVTFDTTATPVEGDYAVARFTSGGELLDNWTATLNGAAVQSASTTGNYGVNLRRDSTGIWLKVAKIKGFTLIMK